MMRKYFNIKSEYFQIWPDGDPSESLLDHYYQVVFFLVTYVIPMVGLSITYCHLGSELWRDYHPQQSIINRRKVKDKRKVTREIET